MSKLLVLACLQPSVFSPPTLVTVPLVTHRLSTLCRVLNDSVPQSDSKTTQTHLLVHFCCVHGPQLLVVDSANVSATLQQQLHKLKPAIAYVASVDVVCWTVKQQSSSSGQSLSAR